MNRATRHHVNTILLLLLFASCTMGIAYGQWVDSLVLSGSVSTGELDVDWIQQGCYDNEEGNDFASTKTTRSSDDKTVYVTVSNGYPGYVGHCSTKYLVRGTIPVYVKSIDFVDGPNMDDCTVVHDTSAPGGSFTATCNQLQIVWANGLGEHLDIGAYRGQTIDIYVLDGSEPATNYGFTITYTFEQDVP